MSEKRKKTRAEVKVDVCQRIDYEEAAFHWVEHLALVDKIEVEELTEMISNIMLNHYYDINEERAISKVCGYPLCNGKVGKRSPHKYHISMKYNKVIDLSVRELFCSLYCYKASKHLESQIPENPMWLRSDTSVELNLLPIESAPKIKNVGEISLCDTKLNDKEENSVGDIYGECDSDEEIEVKNINVSSTVKKRSERRKTKLIDSTEVMKTANEDTQKYITKLKQVLNEWFTEDSFHHLRLLSRKYCDSDDDDDDVGKSAEDDIEAGDFHTKVMNFLTRQPEWLTESGAHLKEENETDENKKRKPVLPTVDSRSQNMIRRRIVHEKIAGSLKDLLPSCGLLDEDLTQVEFYKLIDTFNFTSKNIVSNSKQWITVTIGLIKIIADTYHNVFDNIRKRHADIDIFLTSKGLPTVSQIEEATRSISAKVSTSVRCNSSGNGTNGDGSTCKQDDGGKIVDGNNGEGLYYDDMEELD